MSSVDLFSTKIYHTPSGFDCQKILNSISDILASSYAKVQTNNQMSMRGNGLCTYNAYRKLHNHDEFKLLVSLIETHANRYWRALEYAPLQKPKVYEMWTNVYKKDSFIEMHSHSPVTITASFYLQQPVNGGNLAFENPMLQLMKHQPYDPALIRYHSETWEYSVPVKTGDLILFPGYLNHRTDPNQSDQDRITIGANLWGA
jgi:uncharacterized protein (TIGR02466 family)